MTETELFSPTTYTVAPSSLPAEDVAPHREGSSWVERQGPKRLMVFSGRSNPDLGERIAKQLGVQLGAVTLKSFANGEIYARFDESIRGADVFLVQSCSSPVNRNLMELLIMADAANLGSAKRITAVIPWYPYSRQDKKSRPREPITARMVATLLHASGVDRVLTMDLHAGQVQGFFDGPVDHMTALPMFAAHFRDRGMCGEDVVVVSADAGRTKVSKKFSELLGARLAIISKDRPTHNVAEVFDIIGDVRDCDAVIFDDIIDTAGTLCAGAEAVARAGAKRVAACATHPIFSPPALERIEQSVLSEVVVCDTVPIDWAAKPRKVTVLPVHKILAETIDSIFREGSVSSLFGGENQLF
jgi:ribose-phosphate pyrophosphokinase